MTLKIKQANIYKWSKALRMDWCFVWPDGCAAEALINQHSRNQLMLMREKIPTEPKDDGGPMQRLPPQKTAKFITLTAAQLFNLINWTGVKMITWTQKNRMTSVWPLGESGPSRERLIAAQTNRPTLHDPHGNNSCSVGWWGRSDRKWTTCQHGGSQMGRVWTGRRNMEDQQEGSDE